MYTKDITYVNLDGVTVTETHHFNLTKAEAVEMNFHKKGGLEDYARRIIQAEEHGELVELFKVLILKTYGRRDGQRFVKNKDLTDEFEQTGAYSELFIELATNADEAVKFFREIVPPDMQSRVDDVTLPGDKEYTDEQLLTIPWEEFYAAAGGKDDKNWDKRFLLIAFRRKQAA
ncbi:hypothetical protein SEA_SCAP1_35 [Streptomyces phage Scap1]|uniref:Tail assembly chaperone n=1 Tax=Streptomyces phage Scap1 TaxID=2041354 RepID=A0A2D1GNX2_9CAUD|nr:hypothetical protein FDI71_gp35 [Streptomyces phage Scap1]ATN93684.1 hypothetical protein SEA_SCAP1_35 [Streptomyces phage Scap1]